MITPKELRLGNIVLDDKDCHVKVAFVKTPEFIEWDGGDLETICIEHPNGGYYLGDVKPVLLTSEILTTKCGFLSDETGKHWIGDFILYPIGEGFDYDGKKLVTSVHQLMNLYFAIEGSELPVNF